MEKINLFTIFLTGLLTGGFSCLAVQGGLLATTLIQKSPESDNKNNIFLILSFLISKLIAYTFFGFFLGWLGSLLELSLTVKIIMQVIIAVFMIGTALNLLNVHPIFRYFAIQPPKFLTRLVRKESKSNNFFAPAFLGTLTVFIPCGTTQAIMALAIASGNPLIGALILFTFILGTSPVFFAIGFFSTRLKEGFNNKFMKIAAFAIIFLAIININSSIALTGSKYTLENLWKDFSCSTFLVCNKSSDKTSNNQINIQENKAVIKITRNGYSPDVITIKKNAKITLQVINEDGYGCIQAFVIPKLNIQKIIPPGKSESFLIDIPENETEIAFMCSMGMYKGVIKVL